MAERGHSLESIKASIEARKPDFDAYIDPQKKYADVIIQVRARATAPRGLRTSAASAGSVRAVSGRLAPRPSAATVPLLS